MRMYIEVELVADGIDQNMERKFKRGEGEIGREGVNEKGHRGRDSGRRHR